MDNHIQVHLCVLQHSSLHLLKDSFSTPRILFSSLSCPLIFSPLVLMHISYCCLSTRWLYFLFSSLSFSSFLLLSMFVYTVGRGCMNFCHHRIFRQLSKPLFWTLYVYILLFGKSLNKRGQKSDQFMWQVLSFQWGLPALTKLKLLHCSKSVDIIGFDI